MNISMQIVRGIGALMLCTAVSAFALTEPAPGSDEHEVAIAHSRLTIETLRDAGNQPHYQVASVRVGKPIQVPADQTLHVAQRAARVGDVRS